MDILCSLFYWAIWLLHLRTYVQFLHFNDESPYLVPIYDRVFQKLPLMDTQLYISVFMTIFYGFAIHDIYRHRHQWQVITDHYFMLISIRMIMMSLLPLQASKDMIRASDVWDAYTGTLVHDLFFSGHVSLIALFYFQFYEYWSGYLLLGIAVSFAMLLCRMHYTIDILVAPFISFAVVHLRSYLFA
jgi:hypothetical protein